MEAVVVVAVCMYFFAAAACVNLCAGAVYILMVR